MLILMSHKEIDRLKVLSAVVDGRLSAIDASREMGISPRQTFRLLKKFRTHGAEGLRSKKRGKPCPAPLLCATSC